MKYCDNQMSPGVAYIRFFDNAQGGSVAAEKNDCKQSIRVCAILLVFVFTADSFDDLCLCGRVCVYTAVVVQLSVDCRSGRRRFDYTAAIQRYGRCRLVHLIRVWQKASKATSMKFYPVYPTPTPDLVIFNSRLGDTSTLIRRHVNISVININ